MKDLLIARWRGFSTKEQSILAGLFFVILCLLIYAFVWLPVQQGQERLNRIIPDKKNKLNLMRSQAADVERLRGQFNSIRTNKGGFKSLIDVSAKVNGLTLNFLPDIENSDANLLKITLSKVNFDAWFKWIEILQNQYHVRVESCQIKPSELRGLVNIEVIFNAAE